MKHYKSDDFITLKHNQIVYAILCDKDNNFKVVEGRFDLEYKLERQKDYPGLPCWVKLDDKEYRVRPRAVYVNNKMALLVAKINNDSNKRYQ